MIKTYDDFSLNAFSLDGKVAIITGANMGLGLAYAVAFAKVGCDLFIPHYTDDVSEVKERVEKEGRRIAFYQGDLKDPEYRNSIVPKCVETYGKVDILINNAGSNHFDDITTFSDEAFRSVLEVDCCASYYLGRQVALQMIKQGHGGKIINISSLLAFTADHNCPPYIMSKHAITGLTRYFANDLGKYNIQTNAIAPGFFATDVNAPLRADPAFEPKITGRIPLGRWGEIPELMGVAVFLASPASDYINGWTICPDGGFLTTL